MEERFEKEDGWHDLVDPELDDLDTNVIGVRRPPQRPPGRFSYPEGVPRHDEVIESLRRAVETQQLDAEEASKRARAYAESYNKNNP